MITQYLTLETPTSIDALRKASGLGLTAVTVALVEAGKAVAVKDDGIVLARSP